MSVKLAKPQITADFPEDWPFGNKTIKSWQRGYKGSQFGERHFVFEAVYVDGDAKFLLDFATHAEVNGLPEIAAEYLRTFRLEDKWTANHRMQGSGDGQRISKSTSIPAAP